MAIFDGRTPKFPAQLLERINPGSRKWHRMYFFLAGFDVLVVVLGIFLNHQIVSTYHDSIKANQSWVEELANYSTLGTLASQVNAPGNNVFDTQDAERESRNMMEALAQYNKHFAETKKQLQARIHNQPEQSPEIQASLLKLKEELEMVSSAMNEMTGEAGLIFSYFRAGKPQEAGKRMATMDRKYAELLDSLTAVRERVGVIQGKILAEELESVKMLRQVEYGILCFVLIMVSAAVVYGRRIKRAMESHAIERECYLAILREREEQFRQQASVIDKARDAIVVYGMDHHILYCNQSAERLYGMENENLLGASVQQLIYQNSALFEDAKSALMQTGEWTGEVTFRHRSGRSITVESRQTLVRDDNGQPLSVLSISTDITERKAAQQEIHRLAFHDQLTGLPNRQLMQDRLAHALKISNRTGSRGAVMLIDLDNFKKLNDTMGHELGDQLLRQVSRRLSECVRDSDTVARLGGDEFVVILEDLNRDAREAVMEAGQIGEKILAALNEPYLLRDHCHICTPSIGIALFSEDAQSTDELIKRADLAMYQAKSDGRNAIRFYDPSMQTAVSAQLRMEMDFRESLRRGDFTLCYQPQVNTENQIIGVEGLLRWKHPVHGDIPPSVFIPLAEETGMILELGDWVMERACAQMAQWAADPKMAHLTVAVNVSARQFLHRDFPARVLGILKKTGADPRKLKLELTESVFAEDMEGVAAKMKALQACGIEFSLDDFGTGYSSLSYLKRLPLEQIKIDRSFVNDIPEGRNVSAIVQATIALAKVLGLTIVAEGVENEQQSVFLAENGCNSYQGFFFFRPVTAEELNRYFHAGPPETQRQLIRMQWRPAT